MKKALKVTQSGKNGKSYYYVEKEVQQADLSTKTTWARISEEQANKLLSINNTVSDMTFNGDNMTTIYAIDMDSQEESLEVKTTSEIVDLEKAIEEATKELSEAEQMIFEATLAKKSNVIITFMKKKESIRDKLNKLRFDLRESRAS